LVLTSCDAFEVFPPEGFQYLKWIGKVPFALFLMANTMRLRFLRQTDLAFGRVMKQPPPVQVSDSYASPSYRSSAVRRDTARMLAGISNEHTLRAAASFAQCSMPVLIAWAAEDLLFPRALAERLTAAFPNSTLVLIPESRTFIAEDQPAALAAAILRFVRADGARVKGNP
jgi:pimeloyl-ACP methyl ester carboxylesterase